MVAILTEDDEFTIIELLSDSDFDRGDHVSWADEYGLGPVTYRNLSKQTEAEVYVQNHGVGRNGLRQQLLY